MTEVIHPENREHWLSLRAMDITSTEISSLFGISPYASEFELWHRKKAGTIVEIEENSRMKWGSRLQNAIAHGIAEDQGWEVRLMDEYIRDPELRLGASFDFEILKPTSGLLEIKNVDALIFRDGWSFDEDGDLEAPPHIEIQVQQQMMLSGKPVAHIGALVGGNKVELIERRPDVAVFNAIRQKTASFWQSIELNRPPTPDFIRDADFIAKLYSFAHPGKVLDVTDDEQMFMWAAEHRQLGERIKEMEGKRDALKAQMLMSLGDAEKVIGNGFTISAGVVGEAEISYTRKPYRNFRCFWKKVKA